MKTYKEITNIYWRKEALYVRLDHEQFATMILHFKQSGHATDEKMKRSIYKTEGTYRIETKNNYKYIYCRFKGDLIVFYTNTLDDNKNHVAPENTGTKAIQAFLNKFKELNNDCTFKKAFGYVEDDIKKCIPKSFYYKNPYYMGKVLKCISALDGCSQYPSNLMGTLPDAHTSVEYHGTIKPNEEYPFAFYIKSGHIAEYNRFDSHNWTTSDFAAYLFRINTTKPYCFNNNIKPEDDVTILMKASKYTLNNCLTYFYNLRKTNDIAKLVMNAAIGMFHTNSYTHYKLAHLAAIAIARANNSLLEMTKKIGKINILHICVDGIIYIGSTKYGSDEKGLGIYNQEYLGCEGIIINMNAYIIKTPKGYKVKHGAYNKNKDGSDIDDTKITNFNEVFNWVKVDPIKEAIDEA